MIVRVLFFASLREVVGETCLDLELKDESTTVDLFVRICELYPSLFDMQDKISIAINRAYSKSTVHLKVCGP